MYSTRSIRLKIVKNVPRMMFVQRFMLSFSVRVRKGMNTAISTMTANRSRNSGVISMPATTPSIRSSIMPGSISESIPEDKPMRDDTIHSTEIFSFTSMFSSVFSPPFFSLLLLFRNRRLLVVYVLVIYDLWAEVFYLMWIVILICA